MQRSEGASLVAAFDTITGETRTASADIAIFTAATSQLIDITDQVAAIVAEADIAAGLALISSPHTTCAVIVNEAEAGFIRDLAHALERLAPEDDHYDHDAAPHDADYEQPNGYAHIRSAFLSSPSVMLPIRDGMLALGRWQRIFFVELDHARPRTCQVTLLGRG